MGSGGNQEAVGLREIVSRRASLNAERANRNEAHAAELKRIAAELASLAEREAFIVRGLDADRIAKARQVLAVFGRLSDVRRGFDGHGVGVRAAAAAEASVDLAAGGEKIMRRYFGVKNFDGFGDQRNDSEYGTGPRHGSIVFSIGLTREARDRAKATGLSDEQIADALYLLAALPVIEIAQSEARAA